MNSTDQRLARLAARARRAEWTAPNGAPSGFATRVLANAAQAKGAEASSASLWARWSLASLPMAALLTGGLIWWSGLSMPVDAQSLAQAFVQLPFSP